MSNSQPLVKRFGFVAAVLLGGIVVGVALWSTNAHDSSASSVALSDPGAPVAPNGGAPAPVRSVGERSAADADVPIGSRTVDPALQDATLTFDRASDLYVLAVKAASETKFETVLNGWLAAAACLSLGPSRPELESLRAGLARHGGASQPGQREAAELILTRCRGFFDNDAIASNQLRQTLRSRLQEQEGRYVAGITAGPITSAQLEKVFSSGDWQTFSLLLSDLLPHAAATLGIQPDSKDALIFGAAWTVAACDLGKDCTPSGLVSAVHCVQSARCDATAELDWLGRLSQEDRAKFERYRRWIVHNFRTANAKAFVG